MRFTKFHMGGVLLMATVLCVSFDQPVLGQGSSSKPKATYATYAVFYDAQDNSYFAQARFLAGGSNGDSVDIGETNGVSCNGNDLTGARLSILLGKHYTVRLDKFTGKHDFVFAYEGKKYKNSISIEKIGFAEKLPEKVSLAKGITLKYDGPALKKGELITLEISQFRIDTKEDLLKGFEGFFDKKDPFAELPKGSSGSSGSPKKLPDNFGKLQIPPIAWSNIQTIGTTSVTLPPSQMTLLKEGPAKIRWIRRQEIPVQEGQTHGGKITATYSSETKDITVVK